MARSRARSADSNRASRCSAGPPADRATKGEAERLSVAPPIGVSDPTGAITFVAVRPYEFVTSGVSELFTSVA